MKPQPRYRPGDKIGGRYLVHQALMGGMGEVYLCLDLEQTYPLALKTFQQRYQSEALRKAFEMEVATWVALEKHPNIVRCFLMEIVDNQPFMILEWIAGEEGRGTDLRGWLRHGPLDLQLALDFTIDICRGLIHAAEKQPGIVHRDLKPENILIAQGRLAKITDFGLAQIVQEAGLETTDAERETDERQSVMDQDGIVGTPPYMAPEQWRGEELDARTDIYAVGCILYEMLAGSRPFQATTLDGLFREHLEADIPRITERQILPSTLDTLFARCLAKQQEKRFAAASDLQQQLVSIYYQEFGELPKTIPISGEFTAGDYNNRGNTYQNLRRYEESLLDYTQAIQLDPTFAQAYNNCGNAYSSLQRYEEALANHDQAIQLDPSFAEFYSNRGNTYAALHRYEEALADHNQAIKLEPNLAAVYSNRGNAYSGLQRYEEALADYGQAIQLDPTLAQAYANRGKTYQDLQRYDEALIDYDQAIRLNSTVAWVYVNRGEIYQALHCYEQALADYNRAIQLSPDHIQAYANRGLTSYNLQRYDEALADYDHVIQLDPTNAKAYSNRGVTYEELQRYDEALADHDQALKLDPAYAKAYNNRGNTYDKLQRYDEALADYDRAIQLDPNYAPAYNNRGDTYKNLQRYEEALTDFEQAIQLDPNYVQAYINRGATYGKLQRHREALTDFEQAIQLDPTDSNAYYNRGLAYAALRQYEEALVDFSQAIQLDPADAEAYGNIGAVLGNLGKLREALPYFEKAAQLGLPQAAQYAVQARHRLALEALQKAHSVDEMQYVVVEFPFMTDADFIAAVEQAIAQQVRPENRPAYEQRLAWLRQIAEEQKREE